jgi:hypothetical protein
MSARAAVSSGGVEDVHRAIAERQQRYSQAYSGGWPLFGFLVRLGPANPCRDAAIPGRAAKAYLLLSSAWICRGAEQARVRRNRIEADVAAFAPRDFGELNDFLSGQERIKHHLPDGFLGLLERRHAEPLP